MKLGNIFYEHIGPEYKITSVISFSSAVLVLGLLYFQYPHVALGISFLMCVLYAIKLAGAFWPEPDFYGGTFPEPAVTTFTNIETTDSLRESLRSPE